MNEDVFLRVFARERWRARRGLLPNAPRDLANRMGQSVARFSVRWSWRFAHQLQAYRARPATELDQFLCRLKQAA